MSSEEDSHDEIEQVGCSSLVSRLCTSVGRLLTLEYIGNKDRTCFDGLLVYPQDLIFMLISIFDSCLGG